MTQRLSQLQSQPIETLEALQISQKPADQALYRILLHPETVAAERKALTPLLGANDFSALVTAAWQVNALAGRDAAVRSLLAAGDSSAALEQFKEEFDGERERATLTPISENTLGVMGGAAVRSSALKKFEPRHFDPQPVAGSPFRYVVKNGKKYLELQAGKRVRLMELGPGGARAPQVRFLSADVLEVTVGDKPFLVKLTEDNLNTLAILMQTLSDPDESLTNVMLRGDMGTGKNTLIYTLAGLLNQPVRVMSFHAHTSEKDLRYRTTLGEERAGETSRKHSELYEGAEAGDWVILDEPNKPLQIGILNSLNTILQNRQETLPGEEQPVKASARFRAIALVNPPNRSYTVQEMPADFIRRFNVLDVGYMKKEDEVAFVMDTVFRDENVSKKSQLKPLVEQLVGLAGDIRSSYQQGHLPRPLSTRGVLAMALHIKKFPKDFPYFREIFDPVYPTEYLEGNEKTLVGEYLKQHNLQGQARPADFKLSDIEIDEQAGKVRLGNDKWGTVELPLGSLRADEIPQSYRDIPHLQANLQLWWALMKDRALGRHSLILGETGTGKTQLTGHFLYALLRLRPEEQTFTRQTRGQDITGKPELKNDATFWPQYPLERAISRDTVWLVDEVTKPEDPGTVSLLNNVLQFGQILLPSGKVLSAGPGFGVVAMGTPARAQYEAQEFSGEVLDRFSTHILKPLPAEDEVSLVEDYVQAHGLSIDKPVLVELQKALESLRESYRKGLLPGPPSVQALFRVVSQLGRFPDAKDDLAKIFLSAFPAWEKTHETTIRQALSGVARALGLAANVTQAKTTTPVAPQPAVAPAAPAGTTPTAPAVTKMVFLDDKEALSAFDEKVVGIAATFKSIPKGAFQMGSPETEKGRGTDEKPHQVDIKEDYELQTTPMTWGQLLRIVDISSTWIKIPSFATNPDNADSGKLEVLQDSAINSDHPAVFISPKEAQQIIDHLNSIQSEYTYYLPSEAQWERAARGDSKEAYGFAPGLFGTIVKELMKRAWYKGNSEGDRTHAVGKKLANKFGLYDMLGNVWEMTQDFLGDYEDAPTDGSAQTKGLFQAVRGGSWQDEAGVLRPAERGGMDRDQRNSVTGLRLARRRRLRQRRGFIEDIF